MKVRAFVSVKKGSYMSTEPLLRNVQESLDLGFLRYGLKRAGRYEFEGWVQNGTLVVTGAGRKELVRLKALEERRAG